MSTLKKQKVRIHFKEYQSYDTTRSTTTNKPEENLDLFILGNTIKNLLEYKYTNENINE